MGDERYKVVRSDLSVAVAYLTPHLGGIDTTMLSPAQREEMRQMNAAQLKQLEDAVPAEVVEALKPRAEALRKTGARAGGSPAQGRRDVNVIPFLTSSTRRFCCRPSALSLVPTGLVCPRPLASSRAASIW